ncbi:MAG: hypothetical protein RMJ00_04170, partial [Nitrososphaerota archaeon]|nr:hypothetical protein [Candidatus Bathyarchaeota archaeon]MDW8061875.1 hypothetical protein [Nitrososphaerota archaeon]
REEQAKIWEEIKLLREEQTKFREEQAKIWEEISRIWNEIRGLRDDFDRAFKFLDTRLSRVERTLEKITLDIEDEARIVIEYRLRDMGYEIKLKPLILPEIELNIYGVSDDLCVIGESSVRASSNLIDEIDRDIEKLGRLYPDKLRSKILKVIYTSLAMPDLVERAEKEGVWILKATGDIVKPVFLS